MLAIHDHTLHFWVINIPASPEMTPKQLPVITSSGKCAPKPTRVKTIINPVQIIKNDQSNLDDIFWGIKENNSTVSIVNTVMECPEGKLLCPVNVCPIIVKLLVSKDAAGLGTANTFLKTLEKIAETIEADSKASHNFGTDNSKTDNNDKKIKASPICVRL